MFYSYVSLLPVRMLTQLVLLLSISCTYVARVRADLCANENDKFIQAGANEKAVCYPEPGCPGGSTELGYNAQFKIWCDSPDRYCCRAPVQTTSTSAPTTTTAPRPVVDQPTCGYDVMSKPRPRITLRILGASASGPCDWPWMVSVGYNSSVTNEFTLVCAGVLISNKTILTTASCIENLKNSSGTDQQLVVVGENSISKDKTVDIFELPTNIDNTKSHEGYDKVTGANNTGLLFLDQEIEYDICRIPVCLPQEGQVTYNDNSKCFIAGWGTANSRNPRDITDVMTDAKVEPLNEASCSILSEILGFEMPETAFCAKAVNPDQDVCGKHDHGDMMVCPDMKGKYYLRGLVSKTGCEIHDDFKKPVSVYTDVAQQYDWIQANKQ